jgi:hypothetical protein
MDCNEISCSGCEKFEEMFDEDEGTGCEDMSVNILVYNMYTVYIPRGHYKSDEEYKAAVLKRADELMVRDAAKKGFGVQVFEAPEMTTELSDFDDHGRSFRW